MQVNPIHTRPAKKGDICVLLESTDPKEQQRLRRHLEVLQASFGGDIVPQTHLTVQRFASPDPQRFQHFYTQLQRDLTGVQPFTLTAVAAQTLYVEALQSNLLKWRVHILPALKQLSHTVEQALIKAGIAPLYVPGAVSTLATALRNVPPLTEEELANVKPLPLPLFTVETLVFSRIEDSVTFSELATIHLGPA